MAASPASPDLHDASPARPRTRTRALLLINRKARLGKDDLSAALGRLRAAGFELSRSGSTVPTQLAQVGRGTTAIGSMP